METLQQFCTFFVQDEFFGIPVQQVQEVIRCQEMTRVPLVSHVIRGLLNLRGQIVMAVDLRRRFGLEDRPDSQLPINIIVRTEDGTVSFLVDEIGDVLEVPEEKFERPPETLHAQARKMVRGVYKLQDRLMLVLDTQRAMSEMDGCNGEFDCSETAASSGRNAEKAIPRMSPY